MEIRQFGASPTDLKRGERKKKDLKTAHIVRKANGGVSAELLFEVPSFW